MSDIQNSTPATPIAVPAYNPTQMVQVIDPAAQAIMQRAAILHAQNDAAMAAAPMVDVIAMVGLTIVEDAMGLQTRVIEAGQRFQLNEWELINRFGGKVVRAL